MGICNQYTGYSMGMSDTTLAVGARFANLSGAVFVFERSGEQWTESAILLASDAEGVATFGQAVAIDGDVLVVGAQNSSPNGVPASGAAYVFQRIGGSWVETQKLLASNMAFNARFGYSVAIDGDTIVIGALQASIGASLTGAVYAFERQGSVWVETARLVADDAQMYDKLGFAVSVSGDRLAATAQSADTLELDAGAVYIFEKVGPTWVQAAKVFPADAVSLHRFGEDIQLSGDSLLVGAPFDGMPGNRLGAVYAYENLGGSWHLQQKLFPIVPEAGSNFGGALALSGSTLAVGELSADGLLLNAGAVSIYRKTPDGWRGVLRYVNPDDEAHGQLGRSVAAWGDFVAAGAPQARNGNPDPQCHIGNVRILKVPEFARAHCFGVGCPCGNDDATAGCARAAGSGARLEACGSGSVAADDAALRSSGLPAGQPALLVRALASPNGGLGLPFGDGLQCMSGQLLRLEVRFADAAGNATWGPGLAHRGVWQSGDTFHLQAFYRDPSTPPCGAGFNATNAIEATFGP